MGLAASQVRFLQLTGRKHDISRELQHLSMDKMSLTRDMQALTKEYQTALCSKSMKWSNNSGVSYTDISYSALMRPNPYNMKSPIMISDSQGKIVLDKKYQKYAEMIDAAGGTWDGDVRDKILAELTGIAQTDIATAHSTSDAVVSATNKYNDLLEDLDKWKAKETSSAGTDYMTISNLAKKLGTVNGKDLSALYTKGDNSDYSIKSAADIHTLADGIKSNMRQYFIDDDKYLNVKDRTAFEAGCQAFVDYYTALINDDTKDADSLRAADGLKGSKGDWTIDISKAFAHIMGGYLINGSYDYSNSSQEKTYPVRNTTSSNWANWYNGLKTRQDALEAAKSEYDAAVNTANQVMTADQETMLKYYDLLFQSVVDNGWTYDSQIEDTEYLNQMFQNNSYYITTISENSCYDPSEPISSRNYKYEYDTNIASNFDNIFMVNDSDAREEALVDYEYKKSLINTKETRIDERMKNLETEQSVISRMLESIDKVKSDNIERTFNVFS